MDARTSHFNLIDIQNGVEHVPDVYAVTVDAFASALVRRWLRPDIGGRREVKGVFSRAIERLAARP
jgi:hypothetical protein